MRARSRRATAVFAWGLWAIALFLCFALVWLTILSADSPGPLDYDETPAIVAVYVILALMYPTLGSLIAARHPTNVIGWMFVITGVLIGGAASAQLYADYVVFNRPGFLAGGAIAVWFSSWAFPLGLFVTPMFLVYLFPTGRPLNLFWRGVVALTVAVIVAGFGAAMFAPGPLEPPEMGVTNPFGVTGWFGDVLTAVRNFNETVAPFFFILGIVSLIHRARRAHGDERLQIRWFGYVASVMVSSFTVSFASVLLGNQDLADAFFVIGALALAGMPLASGLAILKYRLYDIDVVINRTLVYVVLTAILAAAYVGLVFAFQTLLEPFTAESDLAIAASTLAVAALFRPVRVRVQAFIDHRFYRRKYDAQQTVERFNAHLRDEVDLAALSSRLTGVVTETMQPAHVSLWMRPETPR